MILRSDVEYLTFELQHSLEQIQRHVVASYRNLEDHLLSSETASHTSTEELVLELERTQFQHS